MKCTDALPGLTIAGGSAIVLTHVLAPGFDHIGFDVAPRVSNIREKAPHYGAIAAPDPFEFTYRLFELSDMRRLDLKFQINHNRTLVHRRPFTDMRNLLEQPWARIEVLGATQRKAHRNEHVRHEKHRGRIESIPNPDLRREIAPSETSQG